MLAARCCGATARAAASAGLVPLQSHLAAASSYYLPSSSCVSPASALAPVAVALSSRRGFHGSSAALAFRKVRQQPGMIANTFFYPPSTEGAAAAILEARRQIFGHVPGDGTRSGRKAFRQKLKGQALKDWYHLRIEDLPLHEVGIENPAREELYRKEEELNRIGKTRIKGKVRGPTPDFVREMKLKDAEEEIMEPIDCFLPEDALPEDESVEKLVEELDLDEEEREWLAAMVANVTTDVAEQPEGDGVEVKKEGKKSKEEKIASARKVSFRAGLDDKRVRPSSRPGGEGEDGEEEEDQNREESSESSSDDSDYEAGAGGDDGGAAGPRTGFSLSFTEEEIAELPEEARKAARARLAEQEEVRAKVAEAFKTGHPAAVFHELMHSPDGVTKMSDADFAEAIEDLDESEQKEMAKVYGKALPGDAKKA